MTLQNVEFSKIINCNHLGFVLVSVLSADLVKCKQMSADEVKHQHVSADSFKCKQMKILQCFFIFQVKSCQNANECSKDYECCGGTCCEAKYYTEFAKLPCISHLGCQVRKRSRPLWPHLAIFVSKFVAIYKYSYAG